MAALSSTAPTKEEEEEEEEEEEAVVDEQAFEQHVDQASQTRRGRKGVSSEAPQAAHDWTPPVIPKTADQEARLRAALSRCFMFSVLEQAHMDRVVAAFRETPAAAGTEVIRQGCEVAPSEPALYVIESGSFSVFKVGVLEPIFIYNTPGQFFGDLALLYNAPRAATVVADVDSTLWSIDRDTFNFLVKDAARAAVQKRLGFLREVPLLNGLTDDEKATICDALQVRLVEAGANIISEGEHGFEFFIVESGACEARKGGVPVCLYESKSYFGELALLREAPRAADVVATETTQLLVLGAQAFKRLLGPLEVLMQERAHMYGDVTLTAVVKRASVHLADS